LPIMCFSVVPSRNSVTMKVWPSHFRSGTWGVPDEQALHETSRP
jgi:hypothetical protein